MIFGILGSDFCEQNVPLRWGSTLDYLTRSGPNLQFCEYLSSFEKGENKENIFTPFSAFRARRCQISSSFLFL